MITEHFWRVWVDDGLINGIEVFSKCFCHTLIVFSIEINLKLANFRSEKLFTPLFPRLIQPFYPPASTGPVKKWGDEKIEISITSITLRKSEYF